MLNSILSPQKAVGQQQSNERESWIRSREDELRQSPEWHDWTPERGEELKERVAKGQYFGFTSPYAQASADFEAFEADNGGAIMIGAAGLPKDYQERGIPVQTPAEALEETRQRQKWAAQLRKEAGRHVNRQLLSLARSAARSSHRQVRHDGNGTTQESGGGGNNDDGPSSDDPDCPTDRRQHSALTPSHTSTHNHRLAVPYKRHLKSNEPHMRRRPRKWHFAPEGGAL